MRSFSKRLSKGLFNLASRCMVWTLVGGLAIGVPTIEAMAAAVDYTAMSLEELMEIEITSVARKPQKLSETAAAAFIITQEDIQRSGVTTIMDALRMAPGIQVAQVDGNKWAITARGFNGRFANKLLVLMDGRTIYSPLFSGVLWEAQDIMLEDVERIEVIRGPGGSVWGANAVNGIINIITKTAAQSQGTLVAAGGGTHEKAFGAIRHGGRLGADAHYRLFAKGADREGFDELSGEAGNNDWQTLTAGFRVDWEPSPDDEMNLHGNIRAETMGQSYTTPTFDYPYQADMQTDADGTGGHILGRWAHRLSSTSETALQLYYVRDRFEDVNAVFLEDTVDIDFQHRFALGGRQEITWGGGYRFTQTDTEAGLRVSFDPENKRDQLFSAFVQDEIALVDDALLLTVGSKFEHNDYTGFEIQPSARIRWNVDASNVLWGAVSRAVRTPSRAETTMRYLGSVIPPMPPYAPYPTAVYTIGSDQLDSEKVWAYELGYRSVPNEWLSVDLAVFYNHYDDLGTIEQAGTSFDTDPVPHAEVNLGWDNKMDGHSYGFEAAVDFLPQAWWKMRLAYTWFEVSLDADDDVLSPDGEESEGDAPKHQVSLLSTIELPHNVQLDTWFRYVDKLEAKNVPSYFTMDVHLAWSPVERLELALVGRNLLDENHQEYREVHLNTAATEVERSVYGKLTWRF